MKALQNPVLGSMDVAHEGQKFQTTPQHISTATNTQALVAMVLTITATAPTIGERYTVNVDGIDVVTATATTAVPADLATLIQEAFATSAYYSGAITATVAGDVVTLTGQNPGESFSVSSSDSELTIATTQAAAVAPTIPFGRFLIATGFSYSHKAVTLPDGVTEAAFNAANAGMTIWDDTLASENQNPSGGHRSGYVMPVMTKGKVFVKPETAPTSPADLVYVRVTADGDLDQIGGVSAAAGVGLVQVTGNVGWANAVGKRNGLYVLALNLT